MPEVSVQWEDAWRFDGRDSKGVEVAVDGEQEAGAKPSDLLPLSLAACAATDLVQLLHDDGAVLESLTVTARYLQQPSPPWSFQRIRLHYLVAAEGVTEEQIADFVETSEQEMCSVAASLRGAVPIESSFELATADDPPG